MPIPIQLRYSTTLGAAPTTADPATPTAPLLIGEPAFIINGSGATAPTKLFVGDTTANRLLLSTVDSDDPIFTNRYLKLSGSQQLTGPITTTQTTFTGTALVTADWVHQEIGAGQKYGGTWDLPANNPNVLTVSKTNGTFWTVDPGGVPAISLPGITAGTLFTAGDTLTWWEDPAPNGTFHRTSASGMTISEADLRYLQLVAGGTVSGTLLLTGTQTAATAATTRGYVDGAFLQLTGGALSGPLSVGGALTVGNVPSESPWVISQKPPVGAGGADLYISRDGVDVIEFWKIPSGIGVEVNGAIYVTGQGTFATNVNVGSQPTEDRLLRVFGTVAVQGSSANFAWFSEDDGNPATSTSEWYMWATGVGVNAETIFAPEIAAGGLASEAPRLTIRAEGQVVLGAGPRAGTAGASDAVRRQDVDTWVTKISGGTF